MTTPSLSGSPCFEVLPVNNGAYTINDRGRTVATITQRGYVDWLLQSPLQEGSLIKVIHKDTHLSYIRGFKFNLTCPYVSSLTRRMSTDMVSFDFQVQAGGTRVVLVARCLRPDGAIESVTTARLGVTQDGSRYEWDLDTTIQNVSDERQTLREIEYNNLYPSLAYRGILHQQKKEFDCTLMQDGAGEVWEFPHQHSMHYGKKLEMLQFGTKSWAGFFGTENSCPVIIVTKSDLPLFWGICDMYYDLHCATPGPRDFEPNEKISFSYTIKYLAPAESKRWAKGARTIPIGQSDRDAHDYPRLDFGLNNFSRGVHIDLPDEACCYRPSPPQRVWDRETGYRGKGSLRVASSGETVTWSNEPPFHAINGTTLRIAARVRVQDVVGGGFFFRLRHYTYCWDPTPGFQPIQAVQSEPITGSSGEWVVVTLPELVIPPGPVEDGLLLLDLVLEGSGMAWATEIDLEMDESPVPLEQAHVNYASSV